jgi:exosortase
VSRLNPSLRLLLPWFALIPVLVGLYGLVPYTYSHLGAGAQLVSVFHAMAIMWERFPDFQHGILVPPICIVLIILRRGELATLIPRGWTPGICIVVLSLLVFWVGRRVDNQYIGFFSIQLLLASVVLWIWGWRWLEALGFPILFLAFAWPLPFLDNLVAFPLRIIMSSASVSLLQTFGVDAIQQGTAIVSAPKPELGLAAGGAFAVDVADPCSGIRSLFALMMVSALYGYFTLRTPAHRLLLFIASIPLAVAGNLARIIGLTVGTIVLGPKIAIGTLEHPSFFHMLSGYAVFAVALAGMMVVSAALNLSLTEIRAHWIRLQSVQTGVSKITRSSSNQTSEPDLY